jgi:hypothetical protein
MLLESATSQWMVNLISLLRRVMVVVSDYFPRKILGFANVNSSHTRLGLTFYAFGKFIYGIIVSERLYLLV